MRYLLCVIIGLCGCDVVLNKSQPISALAPARYYVLPTTMPAELDKENCGAQALGTATASLSPPGIQFPSPLLHAWLHDGATPVDILIVARMNGFTAEVQNAQWEALLHAVQSDARALVEIDSTMEVWTPFGFFSRPRSQSVYHWGAVTGFARDGSALLLAAPGGRDYIIYRDSFMRRWSRADYCLITISAPP
jgi:hypothetical protein